MGGVPGGGDPGGSHLAGSSRSVGRGLLRSGLAPCWASWGGVVEELIPLCDRSDQRTCQFGASAQNVTVLVGLVLLSSRAPSAW